MTTFPTATDLEAALQQLGVLTGALPSALNNIPDAAVQQFLHDTNIRYWMSTDRTDRFPVEHGFIIPHSPIIAVTSLTVDDELLTVDEDYVLHPVDTTPTRYIVVNRWRGNAVVQARFGWSLTDPVPADVWYNVLNSACMMAIENLNTESPGSAVRLRQGDVDVSYSDTRTWTESVVQRYNKTVEKYRLWRLV